MPKTTKARNCTLPRALLDRATEGSVPPYPEMAHLPQSSLHLLDDEPHGNWHRYSRQRRHPAHVKRIALHRPQRMHFWMNQAVEGNMSEGPCKSSPHPCHRPEMSERDHSSKHHGTAQRMGQGPMDGK